jgi:hypothetical protein
MFGMLDLGMLILKILAVAGGAAVGGVGGGLVVRLLARAWTRRPVPRPVVTLIRLLGAGGLGLAVWLWVFGSGGGGFGTGGFGLGGTGEQGAGPAQKLSVDGTPGPAAEEKTEGPAAGADVLRVELLGGEQVQEQRFYRLEGDRQARTFLELRRAVEARRRQKEKSPLKGIEIVIYQNSVNQEHPAVKHLQQWARENELTPTLSFPKRELP